MSLEEALIWSDYRKKRGTLSIPRRIEQGFGALMHMYSVMKGGKSTLISFCPHEQEEEEEIDEMGAMLKAMKSAGAKVKRRGK